MRDRRRHRGAAYGARSFEHAQDAGLRFLHLLPDAPCGHPAHRATDWRLAEGGATVCGICHPAARGLDIELVKAESRHDGRLPARVPRERGKGVTES